MGRAGSVILHQAVPRTRVRGPGSGRLALSCREPCPRPSRGNRMKMCKNARSAPLRREEMARSALAGEMNRREAATSFGVTAKTVPKWAGHFRDIGPAGRADRSTRPRRSRRPAPGHVAERIVPFRCHRLTGARIAAATGVLPAMAVRVIKRAGLSRLKDLEPEYPARHHRHDRPGGMTRAGVKMPVHFDRPGHRVTGTRAGYRQGVGWERARLRRRRLAHRLRRPVPRREAGGCRRVPKGLRGLPRTLLGRRSKGGG